MAPKNSKKRKAEKMDAAQARKKQKPVQSGFHTSPVDAWNVTELKAGGNKCPFDNGCPHVCLGKMKDKKGKLWNVIKVTHDFRRIRWKSHSYLVHDSTEEGELVSPKTMPSVDQMSQVEYAQYQRWEDAQLGGVEPLDPDTLSPFYPGILAMYGTRQVL